MRGGPAPKTSLGRGGEPHFDYACSKRNHTPRTECDAKHIPAEAAEAYVLAELRKWSLSDDEIRQVVRPANVAEDDNLGTLSAEEASVQGRMKELRERIDAAVRAVETGGDCRAVTDRLKEMEAEEREQEPARIRAEREYIRQNTLSAELMAAAYRDVPALIDRLTAAGEWHALRDLIARYGEVVDRQQDAGDPTTGTEEIMLSEEAMAGRELAHEQTLDAAGVIRRCVESLERLPERDTLSNESSLLRP